MVLMLMLILFPMVQTEVELVEVELVVRNNLDQVQVSPCQFWKSRPGSLSRSLLD